MTTRVCLSVDGGGMRGLLPAMLLARLEQKAGMPAWDVFDLMGGTSTGGLIAGALSVGVPAQRLVEMYREGGPRIFRRGLGHKLRTLWGVRGPKYPGDGLREVVREVVGEHTWLSEARVSLVIPSHDMALGRPVFFKSHRAQEDPLRDLPLWVPMVATSSAPTYFPPLEYAGGAFIDGGLANNNPGLAVLTEARKLWPGDPVVLLSLGTGPSAGGQNVKGCGSWGLVEWAPRLVTLFMDGSQDTADYLLRHSLGSGDRLFRLRPPASGVAMDGAGVRDLQRLFTVARDYLVDVAPELGEFLALTGREGAQDAA